MSNMLSNLIEPLEFKYKYEEKKSIFFWVMLGPYIKSRATGGTKMYNKGKQLKTIF